MKCVDLIKRLIEQGCGLARYGAKLSVDVNPLTSRVTADLRHREINDFLAPKICRDLEVPQPI
jgi:hypothetical protein